jgi:hypothetical protein
MSEDGNEVCTMCGRHLDDEEDAMGISGGVAKENDGFHESDSPWEVVGSYCGCSNKVEGFIRSHKELTKFFEKASKDSSLGEMASHLAYEMNITLGK